MAAPPTTPGIPQPQAVRGLVERVGRPVLYPDACRTMVTCPLEATDRRSSEM